MYDKIFSLNKKEIMLLVTTQMKLGDKNCLCEHYVRT